MNPTNSINNNPSITKTNFQQSPAIRPPTETLPFLQGCLDASRRKLYASSTIGLILGALVILYSIWITFSALSERGVTRADMFAFQLFYAGCLAVPIELIVAIITYRQLRNFNRIRTRLGFRNRAPIEKRALLSIVLCLSPILCIGIFISFAIIVSLFRWLLGKS